jgi:O-antigen/teichoic acid export membrane protein
MIQKLFLSDRRYIANVGSTFLSQVVSALSVLCLTPILLKGLGETEFAKYGLILNAIVWGGILDIGMNMGLLRRMIHEVEKTTILFSTLLIAYAGLFFLFGIVVTLIYISLPTILSAISPLYSFLAIFLILQNIVANLLDVMIQSSQNIFKAKLIRIIKTIVEFCCIYFALFVPSIFSILCIMVIINAIYIIMLFLYARKEVVFEFHPSAFDWKVLRGHAQYSIWYFLTTLSAVLVFNSQVFILDKLAGAALLAQYILFMRFFEIVRISVSNFTVVLFPAIVVQEKNQDKQMILSLLKTAFIRTGILLTILFILLYMGGELFFDLWTKNHFIFDASLFFWFLLYTILILIDNVSAIFLSAMKLNRLPTIISLVQGLLALLFTVYAVKKYGLSGAVFSSILALIITNLFFNPFYLLKKLR